MFRLSRYACTSLTVASILTRPFTILYIKTSIALCLLSSNLGHFSSSSMLVTDGVLWYLFTTYLAALRWTISIRFLSSSRYGSQVVHAYSKGSNSKGLSTSVRAIGSQSHRGSLILERKKSGSDPGQFHYATVNWAFLLQNMQSFRQVSKTTASEYLFGIFKRSLETFVHFVCDLFYKQEL